MAVMMGGQAAEELVFGDITTGASNDLQNANRVARKMVETRNSIRPLYLISMRFRVILLEILKNFLVVTVASR